jgi:hypothetical protein
MVIEPESRKKTQKPVPTVHLLAVIRRILRHASFVGHPPFSASDTPNREILLSVCGVFGVHFNYDSQPTVWKNRFVTSLASFAAALRPLNNDEAQDKVKSWTVFWSARIFRDGSSLSTPAGADPFCGLWKRLLHQSWHRPCSKNFSFAQSLLQSKRAWPSLSHASLEKKLRGHQQLMGAESAPVSDEALLWITRSVEVFVACNFESLRPGQEPCLTGYSPSYRAGWGATILEGGARGSLLRMYAPHLTYGANPTWFIDPNVDGHWNDEIPAIATDGDPGLCKTWSMAVHQTNCVRYQLHSLGLATSRARRGLTSGAKVVGIAEPAKWRIITCHDPVLQSVVQPAQIFCLNAWKNDSSSTMRMTDPDYQDWVFEMAEKLSLDPNLVAVSGDYSSATDKQRIRSVSHCWFELCSQLNFHPDTYLAGNDLLLGVVMHYPTQIEEHKVEPVIPPTKQRGGCTMGNNLSFVQLCICNRSTVLRLFPELWPIVERHLGWLRRGLISCEEFKFLFGRTFSTLRDNGDDIAFLCPRDRYSLWVQFAADLGFELSPGKNYVSREMVMINSRVWNLNLGDEVGYLNYKLIYSNSLKGGHSHASVPEKCRSLNNLLRAVPSLRTEISSMRANSQEFLPGSHWFVPVALGGCGLDPRWSDKPVTLSLWHRRLAHASLVNPSLALSFDFPDPIRRPRLLKARSPVRHGPSSRLTRLGADYFVDILEADWSILELLFRPLCVRQAILLANGHAGSGDDEHLYRLLGADSLSVREERWKAADGQLSASWNLHSPFDTIKQRELASLHHARDDWVSAAREIKDPWSTDKIFDYFKSSFVVFPEVPNFPSIDLGRLNPSPIGSVPPNFPDLQPEPPLSEIQVNELRCGSYSFVRKPWLPSI